jgi:hypothetical protein
MWILDFGFSILDWELPLRRAFGVAAPNRFEAEGRQSAKSRIENLFIVG